MQILQPVEDHLQNKQSVQQPSVATKQAQIPPEQHLNQQSQSQCCDHYQQSVRASQDLPFNPAQQTFPFCPIHGEAETPEFLHLLDPKNYKYLPHQYTDQIRPAGRFTHKSEALSNLLKAESD